MIDASVRNSCMCNFGSTAAHLCCCAFKAFSVAVFSRKMSSVVSLTSLRGQNPSAFFVQVCNAIARCSDPVHRGLPIGTHHKVSFENIHILLKPVADFLLRSVGLLPMLDLVVLLRPDDHSLTDCVLCGFAASGLLQMVHIFQNPPCIGRVRPGNRLCAV